MLVAPSVGTLLLWMLVPLAMTLWFSLQRYSLLHPEARGFAGLSNYALLLEDSALWTALGNTLLLAGWVLVVTLGLGTLLAVLFDQKFPGARAARLLAIAPFFVMPTVSALLWKNMMFDPVHGILAWVATSLSLKPIDWLAELPMTSVVVILSWQWLPFALLILVTAMQSLDREQVEAARTDGAGPLAIFFHVVLPHLRRAQTMVILIETIFLLAVFAEIFVTTQGGPGLATTNLPYLIYLRALVEYNVGSASAGGMIAVVLANLVALFLLRLVGRNLET